MGLLFRGDQVLLIKRLADSKYFFKSCRNLFNSVFPDTFAFPGGAVDPGETPEVAIVREFDEEVGLEVKLVKVGDDFVWGQVDDYLASFWRCSFFVVEAVDSTAEPKVRVKVNCCVYVMLT
jgi:8-oxo-dGTP pyrophosphatase MutT (NUDIX family)